jgi:hypothetical protein
MDGEIAHTTGARRANPPETEFVLAVEAGPLETQALRLAESLRRFGGRYAGASVTAASPRPSRRPSGSTIRSLQALGAVYIELDIVSVCPAHPGSWKAHAVAARERQPGPEVIVMLDSDTLFLGDVGPLCVDALAAARPADVKGVLTDGRGDASEPYWSRLCRLAGIGLDALPIVRTTVDDQPVRASYNGGFMAARRDAGLFTHAEELFRRIVEADLRPLAGSGLSIAFAEAGPVSVEGTEWWGSLQAATSIAAASLGITVAPLSSGVNVPVHLGRGCRASPRQWRTFTITGCSSVRSSGRTHCSMGASRWAMRPRIGFGHLCSPPTAPLRRL